MHCSTREGVNTSTWGVFSLGNLSAHQVTPGPAGYFPSCHEYEVSFEHAERVSGYMPEPNLSLFLFHLLVKVVN